MANETLESKAVDVFRHAGIRRNWLRFDDQRGAVTSVSSVLASSGHPRLVVYAHVGTQIMVCQNFLFFYFNELILVLTCSPARGSQLFHCARIYCLRFNIGRWKSMPKLQNLHHRNHSVTLMRTRMVISISMRLN